MNKKQLIVAWIIISLTIATSGCAVIGTAISAGIAYGLYQATK